MPQFKSFPSISNIFDDSRVHYFGRPGDHIRTRSDFRKWNPSPGMPRRIGRRIPVYPLEVALASHGSQSTKMVWFKRVSFPFISDTFYLICWCCCLCFVGFRYLCVNWSSCSLVFISVIRISSSMHTHIYTYIYIYICICKVIHI